MRIKEVKLKNFKFHQNLEFNISKQNCLLYGENGTGKSSIYEALYSVFNIYFRDKTFSFSKFKNNNSLEDLSAKIILDDDTELIIPNTTYDLINTLTINNKKTIYFANQDLLESIIINNDFYDTMRKTFKNNFATLHNFRKNFEFINSRIDSTNYKEEESKRDNNIIKMKMFLTQLEIRANDIINNHFRENFTISFKSVWGLSNTGYDFKYPNPKITLRINEQKSLKLNFNEAKLKLCSIAIFFALVKLEEDSNNPLKLLVLDDFLTSLDMANRKVIVQYILENFPLYQKIILTHNIQFYNLIIRLLKMREEEELWDIKNIFINDFQDIVESKIIDKNIKYLQEAEKYLKYPEYNLEVSGNFIRKEFERILTEYEQLLEIGKVEDLDNIIKALKNLDYIFIDSPNKLLRENFPEQLRKINQILNNVGQTDSDKKLEQITKEVENFSHFIDDKKKNYDTTYLRNTIKKTDFYKNILMNSSSHDDSEKEMYKAEFKRSIEILKKLRKILSDLK